MKKWKKFERNFVLEGDGDFIVSYNPEVQDSIMDRIVELAEEFSGEEMPRSGPETALIRLNHTDRKHIYYILEGDWREEYEMLVPKGYGACLAFYHSKKAEYGSKWSTRE